MSDRESIRVMRSAVSVTRRQPSAAARPRVHWFIRLCAYAIPVCAFPSSLWRLVEVVPDEDCTRNAWESVYITTLSAVSMAAAVLCVGLVHRWGEVVPGWMPVLGGRTVSVRAATIAASAGTVVLAFLLGGLLLSELLGAGSDVSAPAGCPRPEDRSNHAWIKAAYAPLPLWPPLLAIVTVAYYRRRTRGNADHGDEDTASG
jgi:hypothetical protein